jgi:hypothetical protein
MDLARLYLLSAIVAVVAGVAVAAPRVSQEGGIAWVSGGVTGDERAELVLQLPDYNLRLVTAARGSGSFLSDVALTIRDAKGTVLLQVTLDGPMFYARVAAGRYDLELAHGGVTQKRTVTVAPTGRREAFFYWDDPASKGEQATDQERGVPPAGKK